MLVEAFNLDELDTLCDDLGVGPEVVPGKGATITVRAREIVSYFERTQQLPELVAQCKHDRPELIWPEFPKTPLPEGIERPTLCPYPGLKPFTEEQADYFFGREDDVKDLLQRFTIEKPLFIIGPSGSGKSSLVFAGLIPILRKQGGWIIKKMQSRDAPMQALAQALDQSSVSADSDFSAIVRDLLAANTPARNIMLVVDQFEELFNQAPKPQQADFITALAALRRVEDCAIVVTLRADFYSDLMNSGPLWSRMAKDHRKEVVPLQGDELRQAIERPAARSGVKMEGELVQQLLNDAGDEPGSLPLLQETLRELWKRMQDNCMTLHDYKQMGRDGHGGLVVAIEDHFTKAYFDLTDLEQLIGRRILLSLIRPGQPGDGVPDTRRSRTIGYLRRACGDAAAFDETLKKLTACRLITISTTDADTDNARPETMADLAHEVLISKWSMLREWIKDDHEKLRLHERLTHAANEWMSVHDEGALYAGTRLQDAQAYAAQPLHELSAVEQAFLAASTKREKSRERARYLGQAAGIAIGAAIGYGMLFALQYALEQAPRLNTANALFRATALAFGYALPLGGLVGLCIGLALWAWRKNPRRRILATTLLGALAGVAARLLFLFVSRGASPDGIIAYAVADIVVGAVLGGALGLGASLLQSRGQRLIGLPLFGLGAATLVALLTAPDGLTAGFVEASAIGGLVLGGCTALGLTATAVDEADRSPVREVER